MAFKQLPLPFVIPKKLQFCPVTLIDFSYIEYRFVCSERYLCILLSQSLSKYWKGVIFSALGGGELNFSHLKEVSNKAGSFFLHLYTHFTLFFVCICSSSPEWMFLFCSSFTFLSAVWSSFSA